MSSITWLAYIAIAFIFQFFALLFVASDEKCKSNRPLWIFATIISGPVALGAYAYKGRRN